MMVRKHIVSALDAVYGDIDLDAHLPKVFLQHLLVDWVVLNEQLRVSLPAQPLLHAYIGLLLGLDDARGRGPVAGDAEVALLARVEDDGEARRLDGLVDVRDTLL